MGAAGASQHKNTAEDFHSALLGAVNARILQCQEIQ